MSVGQAYSEWGALELAFCNVSADLQPMNFGPPGARWELNLCDWCCLWWRTTDARCYGFVSGVGVRPDRQTIRQ